MWMVLWLLGAVPTHGMHLPALPRETPELSKGFWLVLSKEVLSIWEISVSFQQ